MLYIIMLIFLRLTIKFRINDDEIKGDHHQYIAYKMAMIILIMKVYKMFSNLNSEY